MTLLARQAAAWGRGAGLGRRVVMMVLGSAALALSAKVQVPLWPVPMTMQTLVVPMLGMAFGARLGAAAVLAYLAEGAAGLPVFAGAGAGPAYLVGPTAGFLFGWVPAAYLAGWLAERGWTRTALRSFAVMLAAHAVLFVPGVAWLATLVGTQKAVMLGFVPFITGTLAKSALGAGLMAAVRGRRTA